MATIRTIKRRIKSAKNIGQVTRAMEMVSAVKMRRAQEIAAAGKPYAAELMNVLAAMSKKTETDSHPYLIPANKVQRVILVAVGPDKGLAGSLPTNLAKEIWLQLENIRKTYPEAEILTVSVGKKTREMLRKYNLPPVAEFVTKHRETNESLTEPVYLFLKNSFLEKEADLIRIVYINNINTMNQKAESIQLLPVENIFSENTTTIKQVIQFEPSEAEVLDVLLEHYLKTLIRQVLLDGLAAEHSARMVAMKNASDNATEIVKYLTLSYNQSRQTAITNEIADIVSGTMVSV